MKNINTYLTGKYHLSKYQVAQVVFLLKTILSELSKLLIMAILFHRQIIYYLFGLFIMIFYAVQWEVFISTNIHNVY